MLPITVSVVIYVLAGLEARMRGELQKVIEEGGSLTRCHQSVQLRFARASVSNRRSRSASLANASGKTLMATSRPSRLSLAR